ncbi:MAG: hypothetical protein RLY86_2948 [Pseudomonadota bacterium]|jgi:outer membrane receptor protein involved in Fe transport
MQTTDTTKRTLRAVLLAGAAAGMMAMPAPSAFAQDGLQDLEEIIVTGSRIARPTLTSSSPVTSLDSSEISQFQQPEVERIFRLLPITLPGDGQNVNNGTDGAATVNMRGLGAQRTLVLIDGKRVTPYDVGGIVDVSGIPTSLIERVDIVTGGASAVYGSDAVAGAINFILKKDFEGADAGYDFTVTEQGDGKIHSTYLTLGANTADGKGNVVASVNYSKRDGILFGDRPLGRLGIVTANGGNYQNFLDGVAPTPPPAGCGGPDAVAAGGSGTTLPTRLTIPGAGTIGQFRDDGTIGPFCSVFNFNPYNYYQTPQERIGATAIARYEIAEGAEVYARLNYSGTNVSQQIAPSGIFGTPFWVPVSNPFLSAQARQTIVDTFNSRRGAGGVSAAAGASQNWRDLNNNGVVDAADDVRLTVFRRTVEFGPRSTGYDSNSFQAVTGLQGDIDQLVSGWSYDVSFSYGEVDRTERAEGYTNVSNIAEALNAVSTTTCRNSGAAGCVPLNVFGGFGTITPNMINYSSALAFVQTRYEQMIGSAFISGPIDGLKSPWTDESVSVAFGTEYREEKGRTTPDLCWQLAPASCLGGAGGNQLPVSGSYDVTEFFGEAIIPLAAGQPFMEQLDIETAYRYSDYSITGTDHTWKVGLNWSPTDMVRFRVGQQRAARAPNISELFAPQTASLDNALGDPCSVTNAANLRTNETLRQRCIATGMTANQVGNVSDIISGQINTFSGANPRTPPGPEQGDTTTIGVVVTPEIGGAIDNVVLTFDYYNIKIEDYIDELSPQEVLDACYQQGLTEFCGNIRRVAGDLILPGSGIELFTTNLEYLKAEGLEWTLSFDVDLAEVAGSDIGSLNILWNGNYYLTNETLSSTVTPALDCKGYFSSSCDPTPTFRFIQRTSWTYGDLDVGYLWRYIGEVEAAPEVRAGYFSEFQKIDAHHYFDVFAGYQINENFRINGRVTNVFDKDPPVVGNEAGTTTFNSGNTFPSLYDSIGRVFSVGVSAKF